MSATDTAMTPNRRAFLYRHAQRSGCDSAGCALYAFIATARGTLARRDLLHAIGESDDGTGARARLSGAVRDLADRGLITRTREGGTVSLRAVTPPPSARRPRHVSEVDLFGEG